VPGQYVSARKRGFGLIAKYTQNLAKLASIVDPETGLMCQTSETFCSRITSFLESLAKRSSVPAAVIRELSWARIVANLIGTRRVLSKIISRPYERRVWIGKHVGALGQVNCRFCMLLSAPSKDIRTQI
jgi:hypothetical protein